MPDEKPQPEESGAVNQPEQKPGEPVNQPLKPDDIPALKKLREHLEKLDRKGIDISDERRLADRAFSKYRDGQEEKADKIVAGATQNARSKDPLKKTLKVITIVVSILLVSGLAGFLLTRIWGDTGQHDDIFFGVPLFIIGWGVVGSLAGVFTTVYQNLLKRKPILPNIWVYILRVPLGFVLAMITFHIAQLGIMSLPGPTGAEVSAALGRAEASQGYETAYLNYESDKKWLDEYDTVRAAFDGAGEADVASKADILIKYGARWCSYKPKCGPGGFDKNGELITPELISKQLGTYYDLGRSYGRAAYLVREHVEACRDVIAESKEPVNVRTIESLDRAADPSERATLLLNPSVIPLWVGKTEIGESQLTAELKDAMDQYAEWNAVGGRLEYYFEQVRGMYLTPLEARAKIHRDDLAKNEKRARKYAAVVESVRIENDIKKLDAKIESSQGQLTPAGSTSNGAAVLTTTSASSSSTPGAVAAPNVNGIQVELDAAKKERLRLETELNAALAREASKPVWEAPLFIVIAFLSGYSFEFVVALLTKVQHLALGGPNGAASDTVKPN